MADRLGTLRWRLTAASRALQALSPRNKLLNLAQQLDDLQGRIDRAAAGRLQHYSNQLRVLERALGVVNPLATLARGYAIVRRHDSGVIVTNPAQVAPADLLEVRVHRGRFGVAVTDV
jgi:exodeoxyribonuclease VII large subunit